MAFMCVGCGQEPQEDEEGVCSDECRQDVYGNLNEED